MHGNLQKVVLSITSELAEIQTTSCKLVDSPDIYCCCEVVLYRAKALLSEASKELEGNGGRRAD